MKPSFLLIVFASFILFSCHESRQEKPEKTIAITADEGSHLNPESKKNATEIVLSPNTKIKKEQKNIAKKRRQEPKPARRIPYTLPEENVASSSTTKKAPVKNTMLIEQKAMDSLYAAMDKTCQVFRINTSKDTTITCAEGTIITIPAHCFIDKSRKKISGLVQFEVKEYYAVEDMLFASLNSVSNGDLLESGGMLYMKASQNNSPLGLLANKNINIQMPTRQKVNDMQLFYGEGHDHKLNWKQSKNKKNKNKSSDRNTPIKKNYNTIYTIDKTIVYSKNNQPEVELEHTTPKHSFKTDLSDKQDTVVVTFKMDAKGRVKNYKTVLNNQEKGASRAASTGFYRKHRYGDRYHFVNTQNKIAPGKTHYIVYGLNRKNTFHGIPLTSHSLGIGNEQIKALKKAFRKGDTTITVTMTQIYVCTSKREEEKAITDKIKQMEQGKNINVSKEEMQYYVYDLNDLGWINCDRFYDVPQAEKTTYRIAGNNQKTDDVKIIFTDMKSIMQGNNTKHAVEFDNIPEQMGITVIGIRYNVSNSNYEFATSKTTTSDTETDLRYFPVSSITEMKEKIAAAMKVN